MPSAAVRPDFLSALARPALRISSTAASRSPLVSVSAFLHSIIPEPVRSRSSLTIPAVIFDMKQSSIVFKCQQIHVDAQAASTTNKTPPVRRRLQFKPGDRSSMTRLAPVTPQWLQEQEPHPSQRSHLRLTERSGCWPCPEESRWPHSERRAGPHESSHRYRE